MRILTRASLPSRWKIQPLGLAGGGLGPLSKQRGTFGGAAAPSAGADGVAVNAPEGGQRSGRRARALPRYPSEFESELETEVETEADTPAPRASERRRGSDLPEGGQEVHAGAHAPSDRNVPGWMRKEHSSGTADPTVVPSVKESEAEYVTFQHDEAPHNAEAEHACRDIRRLLEMRARYVYATPLPGSEPPCLDAAGARGGSSRGQTPRRNPFVWESRPASDHTFTFVKGVVHVYDAGGQSEFAPQRSANDFFRDLHHVLRVVNAGPVKSFCHHRLLLLEQKFNMHLMLNADKEFYAQKGAPHRDFYNVRKVDTHVHHSSCMNQKHLLRFIKHKLRKEPDEPVAKIDGEPHTLTQVFERLNLTGYDLNVDTLDMHADKHTFHRFDKFNLKYNPCGQSQLREVFLKQDNMLEGRFLAELTNEVFSDLMASKYQMAEYRISIYGRKASEWDTLAAWVCNNSVHCENVQWLIQIPRLYEVYHGNGTMQNFQQMLTNIFSALFEVTIDPQTHPQLHMFLQTVVGFDMVDDESRPERRPSKSHMPVPEQWNVPHNPAFAYYAYYIEANLHVLNRFRESKGLNTFHFRPHAGEAGDLDHLAASFLLAHNIAHGINLRKSPGLQYLFYLAQVGLCMSPLSNNSLFLDYHKNPLPTFFARGLFVSLSTDDPLQIHMTKEPLVEEYSVAAQVWKLTSCDLCEMARNSVLQSGFPHNCKQHWISDTYWKQGPEGNDIHKTNVPCIRVQYRQDTWQNEMRCIFQSEIQRMPSTPPGGGRAPGGLSAGFAAAAAAGGAGAVKQIFTPSLRDEATTTNPSAPALAKSPPLSPQLTRRMHMAASRKSLANSAVDSGTDGSADTDQGRTAYRDSDGEGDDSEADLFLAHRSGNGTTSSEDGNDADGESEEGEGDEEAEEDEAQAANTVQDASGVEGKAVGEAAAAAAAK